MRPSEYDALISTVNSYSAFYKRRKKKNTPPMLLTEEIRIEDLADMMGLSYTGFCKALAPLMPLPRSRAGWLFKSTALEAVEAYHRKFYPGLFEQHQRAPSISATKQPASTATMARGKLAPDIDREQARTRVQSSAALHEENRIRIREVAGCLGIRYQTGPNRDNRKYETMYALYNQLRSERPGEGLPASQGFIPCDVALELVDRYYDWFNDPDVTF